MNIINPEDLTAFLTQQPHDKTMCRNLRGRVGRWVHDLEYAAKAQYNNPLQVYAGKAERLFEPSVLHPYRKPTTYRYEDTLYPSCTPELFNVEGFCEVMGEMEMPRMMFVGDSLTFQFSQSVWKLLGNDNDPGRDDLGTWTKQIACPVGSVYDEITFTFVRNDQLNDVTEGTTFGTPICFDYCYPWVTEYQSNPARTLLVFNTGAHRYKHPLMQNDIKQFLELLDSIDRPATNDESVKKDVFLFRSTVPGHKECEKMDIEPYGSYDEYIRFWTDKYSWNNFAGYNDFVDRKVEDRKSILRSNPNSGFKDIDILDVFPMTVLRPDGHASSKDCGGDGCGRKDCLHYSLPGAPDWWTHLMYSQLKDMAELEKREKKEDADTKAR